MIQKKHSNTTIRAVLFDFDGTLRHNDPHAHHFFFDHAVSLGAADSPHNRRAASRWAHRYWNGNGEVRQDTERFGYDTPEFWLNYAKKYLLAFNCTEEEADEIAPHVRRHMTENYSPVNVVDPETPQILEELRRAGYVLGVVSNRDKPYNEILDALALTQHFDFTLAAGEVDSWKPDPEIFFHALERSGTKAAETVYIGDNYFADVIGARKAGLRPILIDPESVFPEADCEIIRAIGELRDLLV